MEKVTKTDAEWQGKLDEETFRVTRLKGTEYPHTGQFLNHFELGTYTCVCCGSKLFNSSSKFDAHCGWPAFDESIKDSVDYHKDMSHGMVRVEITCAKCDSHLGHIFEDGPTETGNRYCVNSVSLSFKS